MARVMAEREPDRFVANMSKAKRRGKIFVDYLRNQRGATAICSVLDAGAAGRPCGDAGVMGEAGAARQRASGLRSARWRNSWAPSDDPWPGYFKLKQALPKLK